jgi:TrmH family RNA methyltransferase
MLAALPEFISSRDNPLLKALRRLARDSSAYRKQGRVWVEGDHLCGAALSRGIRPTVAVFSASYWPRSPVNWARCAEKNMVIADTLFAEISALESPANMGFLIELAIEQPLQASAPTVILDRLQDAGNVGAILRSAAAFGFSQVIALKGTAALWSPKVLRAGMGAHFGLRLLDGAEPSALDALALPVLITDSHAGSGLHQLLRDGLLPMPCAWAFGHEGQGIGATLAERASQQVRIAQPGGEESLNVASAAAICLHASATARMA